MTILRKIIVFCLLVVILVSFGFSSNAKIRIIKNGAEIKLSPDALSATIMSVSLGVELNYSEFSNSWYKVSVPSSDNKELIITGYINTWFVEAITTYEFPKENQVISPAISAQTYDPLGASDYSDWSQRLAKANGKKSGGVVSLIVGILVAIPSVYYTFYDTYGKMDEDGDILHLSDGGWAAAIAGDVLAVAGIVAGGILISSGTSQANQLYEEARVKGYQLRAGLVLNKSVVGLSIGISF